MEQEKHTHCFVKFNLTLSKISKHVFHLRVLGVLEDELLSKRFFAESI